MRSFGMVAFVLAAGLVAEARAEDPGSQVAPRGNPLWAIPLADLGSTRERPLFSPSRRPPPTAVVAAPPATVPALAAPIAPPRPSLALIGTILSGRDGYGIFLDQATNSVRRLRTGEVHEGWVLRSVSLRDAMLQKDRSTVVLALPPREAAGIGASGAQPGDRPAIPEARPIGAGPLASKSQRPPAPKLEPYPDH